MAAQAQTGKAAVYRRWPSKEDLVVDALETQLPELDEAADHGSVREDLFQLVRRMREVMYSRSGFALRSVILECDTTTSERFHEMIFGKVVEPSTRLICDVVRRGIARGDVRLDVASGLVSEVLPAMLMYRSKVCGSEWTDEEIAEVIDGVMVPLLRPPTESP